MVIHGGIDGYSRTVVFIRCSNNNRASTLLTAFTSAVEKHGLPERLRTDLGGENVDTWRYMVEQHASTSAVITGSSTHNERIEHLSRDVYRCVGVLYRDCFRKLEEENYLDPLNETDMYCLHFIFIPRINSTLESFVQSWNNHALSTENNLTPNHLFIKGAIQQNMTPFFPHLLVVRVEEPVHCHLLPTTFLFHVFHLLNVHSCIEILLAGWTHWIRLMTWDVTCTRDHCLLLAVTCRMVVEHVECNVSLYLYDIVCVCLCICLTFACGQYTL